MGRQCIIEAANNSANQKLFGSTPVQRLVTMLLFWVIGWACLVWLVRILFSIDGHSHGF